MYRPILYRPGAGPGRRRLAFTLMFVVLLIGLIAVPAAGGNAKPNNQPRGGTAVFGSPQEHTTFNPFVEGGDDFIVAQIGQTIHTGVWEIDGNTLQRIPDVVVELPTQSNGGVTVNGDGTMTVQYDIVQAAQWADKTPISGADFRFTLQMILEHGLDSDVYEDIVLEGDAGYPSRAPVVSDKSFEYTLRLPTTEYEFLFDTLVPKHQVEGSDFVNDWNDEPWVSGGPFTFISWERGEELELKRNSRYWKTHPDTNQKLPLLNRMAFRFFDEDAGESVADAFVSGEVDVFQPSFDLAAVEDIVDAAPSATVDTKVGPIWEHINFQFQPTQIDACQDVLIDLVMQVFGVSREEALGIIDAQFGDLPAPGINYGNRNATSLNGHLKFRQAVAHAIDKQAIVDDPVISGGLVPPLDSYVDAFNPAISQDAWLQYDYDPVRAIELMDELRDDLGADFPADPTAVFNTTTDNPARARIDQLLAGMFAQIGVSYVSDLEDSADFFGSTLSCANWDIGEWAWVSSPGLAGLVSVHEVWNPQELPFLGNFYRWGSSGIASAEPSTVLNANTARFGELLAESQSTVNETELTGILNEMENILADEVALIPLYQRPVLLIWEPTRVAGVIHNPTQSSALWNVETWHKPRP